MTSKTPESVDAYIGGFDEPVRSLLQRIRTILHEAIPGAGERISYGIPTLTLDDDYVIYFAAYTRHVSVYPVTGAMLDRLGAEIEPYRHGQGTLRFPLDAVPIELVRRIGEVRFAERQAGGR